MTTNSLKKCLEQWQVFELTLLNEQQFCETFGIHASTARRWRLKKKLPYLRIQGKLYYRLSDVLPLLSRTRT